MIWIFVSVTNMQRNKKSGSGPTLSLTTVEAQAAEVLKVKRIISVFQPVSQFHALRSLDVMTGNMRRYVKLKPKVQNVMVYVRQYCVDSYTTQHICKEWTADTESTMNCSSQPPAICCDSRSNSQTIHQDVFYFILQCS